ncbi:MAG: nucleotidyltransferase family protein [Pseudohongiellaceae bacterium]
MSKLAIIILAAGGSRRFGQAKQLADINGVPMLQRVFDQCREVKDVDLCVALGANSNEIQAKIDFGKAKVFFIPEWPGGMGATISGITSRIADQYEGLMFIAGDQPLVRPVQLIAMIDYWRQNTDMACCAKYDAASGDHVLGIPAIFPGRLFTQLQSLQGDFGAKEILLGEESKLLTFSIPEAKVDIDCPEDLKEIVD